MNGTAMGLVLSFPLYLVPPGKAQSVATCEMFWLTHTKVQMTACNIRFRFPVRPSAVIVLLCWWWGCSCFRKNTRQPVQSASCLNGNMAHVISFGWSRRSPSFHLNALFGFRGNVLFNIFGHLHDSESFFGCAFLQPVALTYERPVFNKPKNWDSHKWSHNKWSVLPFSNLGERLWHALQTVLGSSQPTRSLKFKPFSNWIVWIIYCRWQDCGLQIWMMAWFSTVFIVILPLFFFSTRKWNCQPGCIFHR